MKVFGHFLIIVAFSIIGVIMAYAITDNTAREWITASSWRAETYEILHFPAFCVQHIWKWLKLPPYGDSAFAVIPWTIFGQWIVIGVLIAVAWSRKRVLNLAH